MSTSIHSGYEIDTRPVDVLSISSQLVYGSVGNNAGDTHYNTKNIRRIKLPTILLSALPHYEGVQFHPIDLEWFDNSLHHLKTIGVIGQLKIVTVGFLGDAKQAEIIAKHIRQWQQEFPELKFILDPTMGDYDVGIYVADGVAEAHREILHPIANGLTPNLFELEQLSQRKISTEAEMLEAASDLLNQTTQWVVVTSSNLFQQHTEGRTVSDTIVLKDDPESSVQEHTILRERVISDAKGAGDLFMAGMVTSLIQGITPAAAIDIAATSVVDFLHP